MTPILHGTTYHFRSWFNDMSSKPRNKKHNSKGRYFRVANILLSPLVLVYVAGQNDSEVLCWNLKRNRRERVGNATALAVCDTPMPWSMFCGITCRRQDGQVYIKGETLVAPHPVKQEQITNDCNEKHKELLKTCNPAHRLTAFWIASPVGAELSEELISRLVTEYKADEFQAPWEIDQQGAVA